MYCNKKSKKFNANSQYWILKKFRVQWNWNWTIKFFFLLVCNYVTFKIEKYVIQIKQIRKQSLK
jgi:hypothetical protein